ncbi:PD-(D/E)XK nuclease-like domain-containing protein [Arhodomonas sp. AD133]|uniref:PD-(D/E)XK nuclease-like domain-containing protein n=1 Tax=Arhodomonas sp. AD133 TaxID=3415009 RepID=UPI003EB71021
MSTANQLFPVDNATGVFPELSNEAYHKAPGISNTGLLLVGQAPAIYYGCRLDPRRPLEKSRAGQLEGTLAHCAILEPNALDERYVVGPAVNKNTKVWKDFVADHPDQIAITADQYDMAQRMRESVMGIPDVAEALSAGAGGAEQSAFWIDEATGERCKVRPDYVASFRAGDILLDVKTYSSAAPHEFARQIGRKGYQQQDAMYTEGWAKAAGRPVLGFVFVAVETEYPYAASAVMLDEDSKAAGHRMFRRNLNAYAECRRTGHWPGYSSAIEIVSLSAYLKEE